jgi:two-component system sensor histidine kinase/response regulator
MFATMAKWITPANQTALAAPQAASTSAELPSIAGIDIDRGLSICAGNQPLYRKLLLKFAASNANFEQAFYAAQDDADSNAALRAAHTLKGVAANIGALNVATAAEVLESACSNDKALAAPLAKLIATLAQVLIAIDSAGLDAPVPSVQTAASELDIAASLAQLKGKLENSDPGSREVAEELLNAVSEQDCRELITALLAQLENYDFDEALRIFADLAARL